MQVTNITDEPPYTDPKLKVYIFGLGTLWFDSTNDRAELGFVNVPQNQHPLIMEICENGQIIYSQQVTEGKTIYISGDTNNLGMGNQYHSANHPQNDDLNKPVEDFRWLIDMDSIYEPGLDFVSNPGFFARLNINVGDAIFYTGHKSQCNGTLKDEDDQIIRPACPIGQVIGISSQKTGSEIRIDNSQNLLTNPSGIYTVIIRYHCTSPSATNSENSDFGQIYDVISNDAKYPVYSLDYENAETPWISSCEMNKMKSYSAAIAEIFNLNNSLSLSQMEEITDMTNYINQRLSCEITCQDVIFGKYSRTV